MEFTPLEETAHLLDQEPVACHICIFCILAPCALLHHQVGVAIAQDVPDANFLCQLDAVDESLVLGHVVGRCEVNLQHITELVLLGRGEDDASP